MPDVRHADRIAQDRRRLTSHLLVPEVPGITNRINGERVVLLGWPRAILMQVAHPLIAAGVLDHSTFRESAVAPIRRLHATVQAMLGLTVGDPAERAEVIAAICSIH